MGGPKFPADVKKVSKKIIFRYIALCSKFRFHSAFSWGAIWPVMLFSKIVATFFFLFLTLCEKKKLYSWRFVFFLRLEICEKKEKKTATFLPTFLHTFLQLFLHTFWFFFLRLEICSKMTQLFFQSFCTKKWPYFFFQSFCTKKWPNFFFNLFALKSDPIFFSIFLH